MQADRQLPHNNLEVEKDKEDHSTPWLLLFSSTEIHVSGLPFSFYPPKKEFDTYRPLDPIPSPNPIE